MEAWLKALNQQVKDAGGVLPPDQAEQVRQEYRALLKKAKKECPER